MNPEFEEIKNTVLPTASLEALKDLRNQSCESAQQASFTLQSQQKFLRRILSPDSPLRNVLLVHGTGTGKTCTAIQVAEEYILRPEYQDRKVMVIASSAVQDNFRKQLFDVQRVNVDVAAGVLESKQCTGRRYLDALLRIESEPRNWNNPDTRERLQTIANKMVKEFYDFNTYDSFGTELNKHIGVTEKDIDYKWIHDNFDNRLLIIDEAHNIRESKDGLTVKGITRGMEKLVKIAEGLVLVLLTATPMFDTFEEIMFFVNLFLWNDRKQPAGDTLKVADFFHPDATLKPEADERFRQWCQTYVSYVKGENPFTFPFRLPPPRSVTGEGIVTSFTGKAITDADRLRYISLVNTEAQGIQREILTREGTEDTEEKKRTLMQETLVVLPENKGFKDIFGQVGTQYRYLGEPCLDPAHLPNHSAKFVSVLESISKAQGIVLVYSNFVTMGARLFGMALEEHGIVPAAGTPLLANSVYQGQPKGKYIMLTSDTSDAEVSRLVSMAKSPRNRNGEQIKVILTSPLVSEGVDFTNVRQIHILDPWWNMSRIEQVIGRGLRTCSHKYLDFIDQNCTVYLHVIRAGDRECFDEYTYRTKVVPKAIRIAKVRKVLAESAMDCPLQNQINTLPPEWKQLPVEQRRSEEPTSQTFRLFTMMAPMFDETPDVAECIVTPAVVDPDHVRPLSTYLDVRDELLTKVAQLLVDKPIWDREELLAALRPYTRDVVIYNLQQAITSGFRFKDAFNRPAVLESKGDFYALSPIGVPNATVVERTTRPPAKGNVPLVAPEEEEAPPQVAAVPVAPDLLDTRRLGYKWPADAATRFSEQTLNGFILDHELTESEKRAYLKEHPDDLPFADRLRIPDTDIRVLGANVFDPPDIPIGDDNTKYKQWTDRLVGRFIERKEDLFASLTSSKKLTLSKMVEVGDTLRRNIDKTQKKFEPIVCGTGQYAKAAVLQFAKYIDSRGIGIPETTKKMTVEDVCVYTELLAREEHNVFWLTPEELSVLYDIPENKKTFTAAFKK